MKKKARKRSFMNVDYKERARIYANAGDTTSFFFRPRSPCAKPSQSVYFHHQYDMYNHEPHDYRCPLCLIAAGKPTDRGNQEEEVIFRDDTCTAFVSGKWWRSNPGHVIIIPNIHIENLYDMPANIGHTVFDLSQRIALALKESYPCEGISLRQHNEPAGNQDVWHYHLHIFPRYDGDNLYLNHNDTYWPNADEKRPYADKLKIYFRDTIAT